MNKTSRIIILCLVMGTTGATLPLLHRWFTEGPAFRLNYIRIKETSKVKNEEIQLYLRDFIGKPLYSIDLEQVQEYALRHPWAKSVSVRRLPPHELQIDIQERQSAALIRLSQLYLVDDEGELFKRASKEDAIRLPVITGISKQALQKEPNSAKTQIKHVMTALKQHQAANKPGGDISELHVSKGLRLTVYFANGLEVILGKDDYDQKWAKLVQILHLLRDKKNDLAYAYLDDYPNSNQVAVRLKRVRS